MKHIKKCFKLGKPIIKIDPRISRNVKLQQQQMYAEIVASPEGHSTFFQEGVCGPDLRSVGLANWYLPLKEGACELKISKFEGLRAKIWSKIEAVETKISKFSQKGVLWTDSFAWNGTLANYRRGVKRGLQSGTSPYPLSRSVPPLVASMWH